jgi:hypothetical protein
MFNLFGLYTKFCNYVAISTFLHAMPDVPKHAARLILPSNDNTEQVKAILDGKPSLCHFEI